MKCNVQCLRQVGFKFILFIPPKIRISENSVVLRVKIKTSGWF